MSGFTLIEMIIAIVIVGIGLAGVLSAFNITVRSSADPLVRKQMLAIAEEMMEEIQLKPFAVAGTPPVNTVASCGGTTPPSRAAFDDVSDYHNYQTSGICNIDGEVVDGLGDYGVRVTVDADATLGNAASGGALPGDVVKMITVVVSHGSETLRLTGWRTNYAS